MFNSLINPSYPKSAIGIEKDNISVVSLKKSGRGRFAIRQAASIDLLPNIIRPSFTETNILNADEFIISLNQAAVGAGLGRQKKWSVSLPANASRVAIIALESKPASNNELEEIFAWKTERSFGIPNSEMRITKYEISPDAGGKARYLASAVKYSVLDEYETIFSALNWHVGLMLPRQICEAQWLMSKKSVGDSLLISSQNEGFTAILFQNSQPNIIRNVSCSPNEINDELYRLMMFYQDRLAGKENSQNNELGQLLVIGNNLNNNQINQITNEAFQRQIPILRADEFGLEIPVGDVNLGDVAAPAGIASLAWA